MSDPRKKTPLRRAKKNSDDQDNSHGKPADTNTDSSTEKMPWVAIALLGLGIFTMVTIEELPIGVLTLMSSDLNASKGLTGQSVTIAGVVAGFVAVLTPTLIGRLDRKYVLVIALVLMFLSSMISARAHSVIWLLASRVVVGLSIGVFWALVAIVGSRITPPSLVARSLTIIFAGGSMGIVLGVPIATWLGSVAGWRMSFAVVGVFGLLVAVLLTFLLPRVPVIERSKPGDLLQALKIPGVRLGIVVTLLLAGGQFVSYTYASPILQIKAHVQEHNIAVMLLVFGVAGLCGNFLIGAMTRRTPGGAVFTVGVGVLLALIMMSIIVQSPVSGLIVMGAWGLFVGGLGVSTQAWVLHASAGYQESATALNSGIFNLSIALGALIGGRIVDSGGVSAVLFTSTIAVGVGVMVSGIALIKLSSRGASRNLVTGVTAP